MPSDFIPRGQIRSILGKLTLLTLIERASGHVQAECEYYTVGLQRVGVDREFK